MAKKSLPLSNIYGLLEPGLVLLLTTAKGEQTNLMTMSWQTMLEFEPPTLACVISEQSYTFDILTDTLECVLNLPTVDLDGQVVGYVHCSGRTADKFKVLPLPPYPPRGCGGRSSNNAMPASNAKSLTPGWSTYTTSLSSKDARRGLTRRSATRERCTIGAKERSWWPAKPPSGLP